MIDRLRESAAWRLIALTLVFVLAFTLVGCKKAEEPEEPAVEEEVVEPTALILASTTSTQDSGLFDVLIPAFEEAYPEYKVEVIAVGTGEALKLGENKDADVLLVHAKAKEETFVAAGFGTERRDVMYNDFVIVGPAADPAGIKGMTVAADAFMKIKTSGALFVSRGDDSGTYTKEISIWKASGETTPTATPTYQLAGKGMGDVLKMASEQAAYTLSDRATFLKLEGTLQLEVLVEGDKALFNQYGVIPVTDATNAEGAQAFMDWILSDEGQSIINEYGVEEFGQPLFIGNPS
ncbi:MAG: extracellular solute-binding protein [Actinobacteria bacterium]|nr:extracellular solute-binding protein [Actinomycetota bacterium]